MQRQGRAVRLTIQQGVQPMSDLVWLLVTAIFFVVALGYVWASDRL